MKSYETLIEELQPIAKKLKNTIFPGGREYGCLALICEDHEYGDYIELDGYVYTDPVPPEAHPAAVINESLSDVQRDANKDIIKRYIIDYNKVLATQNVLCQAIVQAVDEEYYIEALKKPVIKFDSVAPFDLLAQIKSEIC